jgi:predicted ATP-grasp superfamily ATP-dependent carboligase
VIEDLSDKLIAARLLRDAGFPVPETSLDADDVPVPAVVKPRRGSGAAGVVYVSDRAAARAALAEAGSGLVQEYIPGTGVGVSLLIRREGGLVAAFAHERIRERPATGGASTARVAVPLPPFTDALADALHARGFFGPVHVEFRRDERDGSLRPIEINPRYWGSLALAIAAGVPFPALHARLALGEDPAPILGGRIGTRCRWFLFGEMLSGFGALRRGRIREALSAFRPGGPFDILSLDDPGPAAARLLSPAVWIASPGLRQLLRRDPTSEILTIS